MEKFAYQVLDFIERMEPQHWVYVLAGVILIGYLCLKSVGQRSHY
jgi:hypothetical protein